jgi:serine beta-lactamase-like protein LACTB, mitochondrial
MCCAIAAPPERPGSKTYTAMLVGAEQTGARHRYSAPQERLVTFPRIVPLLPVLALAFGALNAPISLAQDAAPPASTELKIERAVTAFMSKVNAPGVSVAVSHGPTLRWANGYGLADVEQFVPAKADTVYRLASVSKPITAVAAMQLIERGRLSLDDTVGKWLPDAPSVWRPITIEQLLTHQSGIRHYTAAEEASGNADVKHYASLRDALAIFSGDPLLHQPGAKMTYSTYAYTLLGVVIEAAAGQDYVIYVTKNIFEPAAMRHSRVDDVHALVPNRSPGYARTDAGALRRASFMDSSYKIPGGGWLSTAGDLVRFGLAVQDGTLIKPSTFKEMTVARHVNGQNTGYGLGWIVDGWGPGTPPIPGLVWHGGVQQGVTTNLYMFPDRHIAIAILANLEGQGLAIAELGEQIARIVSEPPKDR